MSQLSEKDLDFALEDALRTNVEFADWFINQTSFAGRSAARVWSRSNYPWTRYEIEIQSPVGGLSEIITREGETDVLVVFEHPMGGGSACTSRTSAH